MKVYAVDNKGYNGFVMAILRSAQTPGTVTVKVTATGLKKAAQTWITK
jgi:hypothetical protein